MRAGRGGAGWPGARTLVAALTLAALCPGAGRAQEEPPPPPPWADIEDGAGTPGFPARPRLPQDLPPEDLQELEDLVDLEELESWIVLREEAAVPQPLLRLVTGSIFWIDVQSQLRADKGGVQGTRLEDLEVDQGLPAGGVSPWVELSIGRDVRGGFDYLYLQRRGSPEIQDQQVVFDGTVLAQPGDAIDARFTLATASGYVEWDPLYGRSYRFGLLGGARYFLLSVRLMGLRASGLEPTQLSERRRGELISPFFGGFVELTPFSHLTMSARVQFMNWSWSSVGLKDARYLDFRLGGLVHLVPELLSVGLEFRYFVVRAASADAEDRRLEAGLAASGVAVLVSLTF